MKQILVLLLAVGVLAGSLFLVFAPDSSDEDEG